MTKILEMPKHMRPREKLIEKGAQNLKSEELLAILLRTGRQGQSALDIAKEILKQFPVDEFFSISLPDLKRIKGVDEGKACTIMAAIELMKRVGQAFNDALPVIDSPKAAMILLSDIRTKKKEYFVALYLNARNQLVAKEIISVGTLNSSLVHPREVFEPAIHYYAASIILAHNHPSGDMTCSSEDRQITDRLIKAGELLGIEIIDHMIVTMKGWVSFREKGWI